MSHEISESGRERWYKEAVHIPIASLMVVMESLSNAPG